MPRRGEAEGGLRLDTAAAALKGGDNGPAVVPGKVDESLLLDAVTGDGGIERMPLKRPPLSDEQIATLKAWIDQGAQAPAAETPSPAAATHWAFVPPQRPAEPRSRTRVGAQPHRSLHPGPAREGGVRPSAEADRATLLRRLSLDLLGLPPSPAEIEAFLADTRPDAYERLVDRLLASPHFGERWARSGSTWPATPTPTATASTPRARSGSTATGSSTP